MPLRKNKKKTTIAVATSSQQEEDVSKAIASTDARANARWVKNSSAPVVGTNIPSAGERSSPLAAGRKKASDITVIPGMGMIPRKNTRSNNNKEAFSIISKFKGKTLGQSQTEDVEIDDEEEEEEEWRDDCVSDNFNISLSYHCLLKVLLLKLPFCALPP